MMRTQVPPGFIDAHLREWCHEASSEALAEVIAMDVDAFAQWLGALAVLYWNLWDGIQQRAARAQGRKEGWVPDRDGSYEFWPRVITSWQQVCVALCTERQTTRLLAELSQ